MHSWEVATKTFRKTPSYATSGISATTLKVNPDGTMDLDDIEDAIRANVRSNLKYL